MSPVQVTLLGTNGWFDTYTGNTPCVLVQTPDCDVILDAGYGFAKLDRFIRGDRPAYLLLSHFHLDHLIGLHTLAKFQFQHGLTIIGQPGTKWALESLLSPVYSVPLSGLRYPVHIVESQPGKIEHLPFEVLVLPLIHSQPCFGYRLQVDGKVLAYCTDTGYCENAVKLAQHADILLTECSQAPGTPHDDEWPHLSPTEAARIAREAEARQLVLIHFDPTQYPTLEDRIHAETEARKVFSSVTAGRDELHFTLA